MQNIEKLQINQIIVVEGKNDVKAIEKAVKATFFILNGFNFKKEENFIFLKKALKEKGLIIFTDPDHAGNMIRSIINKKLKQESHFSQLYHAYINQEKASKGMNIGIENAKEKDIIKALSHIHNTDKKNSCTAIKWLDFLDLQLNGYPQSKEKRQFLASHLHIPYSNSKTFFKTLQDFNISLEQCQKILKNFNHF